MTEMSRNLKFTSLSDPLKKAYMVGNSLQRSSTNKKKLTIAAGDHSSSASEHREQREGPIRIGKVLPSIDDLHRK